MQLRSNRSLSTSSTVIKENKSYNFRPKTNAIINKETKFHFDNGQTWKVIDSDNWNIPNLKKKSIKTLTEYITKRPCSGKLFFRLCTTR